MYFSFMLGFRIKPRALLIGTGDIQVTWQFNKMYLSTGSKDAASRRHYNIRWSMQCSSSRSVPELTELHHFSNDNTNPNSNLVVLKL